MQQFAGVEQMLGYQRLRGGNVVSAHVAARHLRATIRGFAWLYAMVA
jgi:hypothetical protein